MYRALYRKWRPAKFSDVVGQKSIVTALKSQLLQNKVGHAYIFTGTRGTGKTTCAKIFAKAVNCLNLQNADPCGECDLCTGIESGAILDVVEIDAASNNGVDNIRDLRDETAYTPSAGNYKVYIIDEVHMLSTAAFNALLKIMEEPPSHVIFILATTEIHKVPATILSRCQRYDFIRINTDDIAMRLVEVAKDENIALTSGAAGLIARLADGAMRDALSILDTCSSLEGEVNEDAVRKMAGVTDKTYLFELSDAIHEKNVSTALLIIARLRAKSIDMKRLCDELILHYRNLMLCSINSDVSLLSGVSHEEETLYFENAKKISTREAIGVIKTLSSALEKMGKSADLRITLETAMFYICENSFESFANVQNAANVQNFATAQSAQRASYPVQTAPVSHVTQSEQSEKQSTVQSDFKDNSTPNTHNGQNIVNSNNAINYEQDLVENEREIHDEYEKKTDDENSDNSAIQSDNTAVNYSGNSAQLSENQNAQSSDKSSENSVQGEMQVFEKWQKLIDIMQKKDKLLYVNLKDSKAYFDGVRVRIDGSDLFMEYMRQNEYSSSLIRDTIEEVCGKRYAIGPYRTQSAKAKAYANIDDTISKLEAHNVPIIYNDKK